MIHDPKARGIELWEPRHAWQTNAETPEKKPQDIAEPAAKKAEQLEQEGHRGKTMLKWANAVEKVHAELYHQAVQALQAGKDLSTMEIYVCPVCGNLEIGAAPDKCPVCGLAGSKFQKAA